MLEKLFVAIFDGINEKCAKQLEAIDAQYPFEPLQVGLLTEWKLIRPSSLFFSFILWIFRNN